MFGEAETWFTKWRELRGDPGAFKTYIPAFCAALGRIDEAKNMMKEVERDLAVSPVAYAYYHMWLGNIDLAFKFLEKAYETRDSELYDVKVDPNLDPLRSDPRFEALLKKLHLS
jgi:hypothetical protein